MKHDDNDFPFDEWANLATQDPRAFEDARSRVLQSLIESAPSPHRRRLEGLQWQIDRVVHERNHQERRDPAQADRNHDRIASGQRGHRRRMANRVRDTRGAGLRSVAAGDGRSARPCAR